MKILKVKTAIAKTLLPTARWYVHHFPFRFGKAFVLSKFRGRNIDVISSTKFGIQLHLNTKDFIQGYLYFFGMWEPNLTEFIQSRLKRNPDRTFVDVGANIGYFSLLAANALNAGRVVAIEAFPGFYEKLVANVRLNDVQNIRLVNKAATNKACVIDMFYSGDSNSGRTSVYKQKAGPAPVQVEGDKLSAILLREEIATARILKIDVEGHEYEVLSDVFNCLNRFPADLEIVCEISPDVLGAERVNEIFKAFSREGFYGYVLKNDYRILAYIDPRPQKTLQRIKALPESQFDVVFSRVNTEFLTLTDAG